VLRAKSASDILSTAPTMDGSAKSIVISRFRRKLRLAKFAVPIPQLSSALNVASPSMSSP
jgi:hypothetical protein